MSIWTRAFWKAATERVIASVAGGALAVLGADAFNVLDTDWQGIAAVAAGAGVVSLLKAVAAGAGGSGPSVGNAERLTIPDGAGRYRADDFED